MTQTRSRRRPRLSADLSPEVRWYLNERGYDVPTCVPLVRTPEPRTVKGALFDPARVDRAITALKALRHTKGKWAGRPIEPSSAQVAFIIAPIFGWVAPNDDGELVRIIREAYVEMPRKGAKTTLVSALATILAFADDEPGAEVLMGAASRDQAGQAFRPIAALAKGSQLLKVAGIRPTRSEITQAATGSFIKAVSSRGDLAHGANVHGGLVDELHVHKSPDLLEAIESGTGARTQPLVFIITTAGDGSPATVYAQRRHLIEQLAARTLKAPAMYGVVFAASEKDDPFSEATWAKANPLYPVTPSREYMRAASDKARGNPTLLASFLRLHLGIRASGDKRYIDLPRWDRNAGMVVEGNLAGRVAYGGLDLGSVSDLTALAWLLPDPAGGYDVVWRFWMPEAALEALDARTARSASGWVKAGHITLTPGDVTDYEFVKRDVLRDLARYAVVGIGYDRWNSSQCVIDLENDHEAPMVKVGQGFATMSAPMKELDRLVRAGTARRPLLRHGSNPVARWQADNLRAAVDASGNVKPDKARSMDKIDGMSALITALSLAMGAEPEQRSAYEDDDLMVV